MNCMEAQALVEDALDNLLTGSRKRALDLHLSRCDACRAFFDAERNEHRRWFQAMNDPAALRRLPDGFTDQFVAEMAKWRTVPQRKWMFVRAFRRIAAALVAMLLFAGLSYAAVVAIDGLRGTETQNQNAAEGGTDATSGTTVASDASDSVGIGIPEAQGFVSLVPKILPVSQSTPQGEQKMTGRKAAAVALMAALAASAPVLAYNSLAPHNNTENTDFWDTRGYNVIPASSALGICATELNRCVRTDSGSNVVQSFRRIHVIGFVIELR